MTIRTTQYLYSCIATMLCLVTPVAIHAFTPQHFADNSRLANGHWVKIAVPADGVYEITQEELQEMGFSNPEAVHVYGRGGHVMSEVLTESLPDDLSPVSSIYTNGKLCFYGCGPVSLTMAGSNPMFSRKINTYSTQGYYFLCEGEGNAPLKQVKHNVKVHDESSKTILSSYDYVYHETESHSYSLSGKVLLGENITSGETFDAPMPGNVGSTANVHIESAVKFTQGTASLKVNFINNGKTTPLTLLTPDISPAQSAYYTERGSSASFDISQPAENAKLNISFSSTKGITHASLDYFVITYTHSNSMNHATDNQMRMAFPSLSAADRVAVLDASSHTIVWQIDNPAEPVAYEMAEGEQGYEFTPSDISTPSHWVAFDPTGTLKKISSYEAIPNQNLHAMEVPHMLIITHKDFEEQAQRIAQMHRDVDNMDVAIAEQGLVFNEFSSGTPDAMAYRLLCKMLYDRDNTKFKYLLLVGEGSFDNRGFASNKPYRLLTYQSDNSYSENLSYVSDDFFGFLDDNSGTNITSCKLSIGVGRIPASSLEEAKNDVDKLLKYVLTPDYGPWRNNAFISAEYKSETNPDLHQSQAELLGKLFETDLNTGFGIDKAYVNMYPRAVNQGILSEGDKFSAECNKRFSAAMHRGQFFATYVGHAGTQNFTTSLTWTTQDVNSNTYPHLPIFTTACCDVARIDDNQRCVAEHMFHKTNGGAIALLASTRQVLSTGNDNLNRAFVKNMFTLEEDGSYPRLGDIVRKAKHTISSGSNHLKFILLGDPAMKVATPRPLFNITEINGTAIDASDVSINVAPLDKILVKAQVLNADNSVNTNFNGEATLTVYDKKAFFKYASETFSNYLTNLYYPREILAQVQGRVVDGIFTGTAVIPSHTLASTKDLDQKGQVIVYAHQDGTDNMVNGHFDNLNIVIDAQGENTDETDPEITEMYINDKDEFELTGTVGSDCMLHVLANDNLAISNQTLSLSNNMRLVLDSKITFPNGGCYVTVADDGKQAHISFPLSGLSNGKHTIACTLHDVAGNSTTRTLQFNVNNAALVKLNVEETAAITQATICATAQEQPAAVKLKVTDALGNIVWTCQADTFPVTWNLKDNYGRRVPGGLYKVFGTYASGNMLSGTNVTDVIVLSPAKKPIKK